MTKVKWLRFWPWEQARWKVPVLLVFFGLLTYGAHCVGQWTLARGFRDHFPGLLELNDTEAVLHALQYYPELGRKEFETWKSGHGGEREDYTDVPLHCAVRMGNSTITEAILNTKPVVDTDEYGIRPLTLAAASGHADIVRMLLGAGADVNATGLSNEEDRVINHHSALIVFPVIPHWCDTESSSDPGGFIPPVNKIT